MPLVPVDGASSCPRPLMTGVAGADKVKNSPLSTIPPPPPPPPPLPAIAIETGLERGDSPGVTARRGSGAISLALVETATTAAVAASADGHIPDMAAAASICADVMDDTRAGGEPPAMAAAASICADVMDDTRGGELFG